jgi:hypothetical protein
MIIGLTVIMVYCAFIDSFLLAPNLCTSQLELIDKVALILVRVVNVVNLSNNKNMDALFSKCPSVNNHQGSGRFTNHFEALFKN